MVLVGVLVVLVLVVVLVVGVAVVAGVVLAWESARRSLQDGFSVVVGTKFHHFLNKLFKKTSLNLIFQWFFVVKKYDGCCDRDQIPPFSNKIV